MTDDGEKTLANDPNWVNSGIMGGGFTLWMDDAAIGVVGRFQEISGLGLSMETLPMREGGVNDYVHHLPGQLTWTDLTLKRGVTRDEALFNWMTMTGLSLNTGEPPKLVKQGPAPRGAAAKRSTRAEGYRPSGTITMFSRGVDPKPLRSWTIAAAMPIKWTGPKLVGTSDELPDEELVITHEGLMPSTPSSG